MECCPSSGRTVGFYSPRGSCPWPSAESRNELEKSRRRWSPSNRRRICSGLRPRRIESAGGARRGGALDLSCKRLELTLAGIFEHHVQHGARDSEHACCSRRL